MHYRIDSAKSLKQRGMVSDVGDNQGNSIDEFGVAGGEIVIDNYVVARRDEFSHGVRSDVSRAPGNQYPHVPPAKLSTRLRGFPLLPTTISELPNGMGKALRVFCSKRDIRKRTPFAQPGGTVGALGWE